jgi:16S rRNA (guanine966-N2)-methyltransferase
MRIIGGKYQRRTIIAPAKLPVRPTTDMAKEALFSIINNHLDFESITVLDLFAGTGNISYEFASRGAEEVIAVDINNHCVQFIRQTIDKMAMENLRAVRAEVFHFLSFCKAEFDVVFADPPFEFNGISEIPGKVFEAGILKPGGWLVLEHGEQRDFSQYPGFMEMRRYGKVHFSFFRQPE